MPIFNDENRTAREALKTARQDLAAVPVADSETPEYLAANGAVISAEQRLPAWKRVDVGCGFYDEP